MKSADGTTFIIAYQYANDGDLDELTEAATRELTNKVTQRALENEQVPSNNDQKQQTLGDLGADVDRQFLEGFLSGRECLPGGTGWWRYEICYGKHVIQFHVKYFFFLFEKRKFCFCLFFFKGGRSTSNIDFAGDMES
jgi:hypothetical protein